MGQEETIAAKKLEELRSIMKGVGVSAYIVPSADPHLMEFIPRRFERRAFISGFTGSAGQTIHT